LGGRIGVRKIMDGRGIRALLYARRDLPGKTTAEDLREDWLQTGRGKREKKRK